MLATARRTGSLSQARRARRATSSARCGIPSAAACAPRLEALLRGKIDRLQHGVNRPADRLTAPAALEPAGVGLSPRLAVLAESEERCRGHEGGAHRACERCPAPRHPRFLVGERLIRCGDSDRGRLRPGRHFRQLHLADGFAPGGQRLGECSALLK
jgi:hypothetical protein